MAILMKLRLARLVVATAMLCLVGVLASGVVLADSHEGSVEDMEMGGETGGDEMGGEKGGEKSGDMKMDQGAGMGQMKMDEGAGTAQMKMDEGAGTAQMKMDEGAGMAQMPMDEGAGTGQMQMDQGAGMGQMQMGGVNTWQDQVNRISYPFTAVAALFAVWVCIMLMRATGMVDKFSLISFGLALFFIQSVVGVLFYLTKGAAVSMPMLMFIMSLFNSIALLLIGGAFYRWKRMIG